MLNPFVDYVVVPKLVRKFSYAVVYTDSADGRTKLSFNPRIIGTKGFEGFSYAFAFKKVCIGVSSEVVHEDKEVPVAT